MRMPVPIREELGPSSSPGEAAAAAVRMELMRSDVGNELPGARKIILKCLCMRGARRTAAPASFLCVVHHPSSGEMASFPSHPGAPASSAPCRLIFLHLSVVLKI